MGYHAIPIGYGLATSTSSIIGSMYAVAAHESIQLMPQDLAYLASATEDPNVRMGREDALGVARGSIGLITQSGYSEILSETELPEIAFIIGIHSQTRKTGTISSRRILENVSYRREDVSGHLVHKVNYVNFMHSRGLPESSIQGLVEEVMIDSPAEFGIDYALRLQSEAFDLLLKYELRRPMGSQYRAIRIVEHLPHDILQEPVRIAASMNAPLELTDLHRMRGIVHDEGGAYTKAGASGADLMTFPRSVILDSDGLPKEDVVNRIAGKIMQVYADRGLMRDLYQYWVTEPTSEGLGIVEESEIPREVLEDLNSDGISRRARIFGIW
jgi:hypothetical protein